MRDLGGQLAVVTGAGRGVGKVIARRLAERGAHVIINFFHSLEEAKQTEAELLATGARVDLIRASVAQPHQVQRMFQEIEDRFGYLDILVNNAASGRFASVAGITEDHFARALDTNLKGAFWCSRLAAPLMDRRGGGRIVNVSSIGAGLVPANYLSVGVSKAGLEALTRHLAVEYAPLRVRVNTASASLIDGEVARLFPDYDEVVRVTVASTPLGRLATADDLAGVVMFLTSELSGWVTGQTILADGGLSLGSASMAPPRPPRVGLPVSVAEPTSPEAAPLAAPVQAAATEEDVDEIAVVGMGLAVPGASDPEAFWRALLEGPELFRPVPEERWDYRSFWSAESAQRDKTYQARSAFITDFAAHPALQGDPTKDDATMRWLRHSLLQALDGVGQRPDDRFSFVVGYTADGSQSLEEALLIAGTLERTDALLNGSGLPQDARQTIRAHVERVLHERYWRGAAAPLHSLPHSVGRDAMQGVLPDHTELLMVDTACSSSLYAIDVGIKGLLMGRHDVAVCGGSFSLAPRGGVLFAKLHGLSVSGEVRPLDKDADGVLFSDGAGVVVLKRLRRALADGDPILGIIKSVGASSDGKGKAIYAPSSAGQCIAIERAYAQPGARRESVDWIVAHATGTPAGDSAEFATLREAFAAERPVYVTSNKSLIGHTGWAAGVVSLIEVLLAFKHRIIPPQHHFNEPPREFGIERTNLVVPTRPMPWQPRLDTPRAAAISGFGFGGTNAHLVVEDYVPNSLPRPARSPVSHEPIVLVGWSAHVPGLATRSEQEAWLGGRGPAPDDSFGRTYPLPPVGRMRMPPATARTLDRCQLMVLECAHDLRRQLGDAWESSRERTGIFMGHMAATRSATLYASRCYLDDLEQALKADERKSHLEHLPQVWQGVRSEVERLIPESNENSFPGMMPNVIPARIANHFDLHGPNMTIDTGVSSTLTSLDVACRYLRSQELDLALVGGTNGNTTPDMQHLLREAMPSGVRLAEGAFMLALMTRQRAIQAGLEIVAYVEPAEQSAAPANAHIIECDAVDNPEPTCYLGGQGAVGILTALHGSASDAWVVSRDGPLGTASGVHVRLNVAIDSSTNSVEVDGSTRAATLPAQFLATSCAQDESREVKRQIARLADQPLERVHSRTPFYAPRTVVLTNSPQLVPPLGSLPQDLVVISTTPPDSAATSNCIYLPDITLAAVQRVLGGAHAPISHIRVLADVSASAPPPDCLEAESDSLVALHDLTFLTLQHCHTSLERGDSSFVVLLLGALPSGALHPYSGLFGGTVKSAALELPRCRSYAVFASSSDPVVGVRLAEEESTARQLLPVVVYQNQVRKTIRIEEVDETFADGTPGRIDRSSVVVAAGGARGITAEVMKALAQHFQPRIYVIGSNPIDAYPPETFVGSDDAFAARRAAYIREHRQTYPDKSPGQLNREFDRMLAARTVRRNLETMAASCGANRVTYLACDVLDRAALERTLGKIVETHGRIDLLINAPGINRAASIAVKTLSDFRAVRDLKVRCYLNLKHALRTSPPRMWCNFGSFIGLTGQLGETDYAAANDFLAAAATYSQAVENRDEFTLGWPLWQSVGLGANPLTRDFLEKSGLFTSMSTEEGVHHFIREVSRPVHSPSVIYLGRAEKQAIIDHVPDFFAPLPLPSSKLATPGNFYLGRVLSQDADSLEVERVFDLERDSYLTHHCVNGYPTLPGTFVPEIAAEVALQLCPDLQVVALENITFKHFLRIYAGSRPCVKKIRARVAERNADRASVHVQILTDVLAPSGVPLVRDKLHFELDVLLRAGYPPAPYWEPWEAVGEVAVPDPYHMPGSPVLLTGPLISTRDTRSHPLGKRATFVPHVSPGDAVFDSFVLPSILLDGLARVAVVDFVDQEFLPIAAPASIRRIDVYESGNDCQLARRYERIELYVTPRRFELDQPTPTNRFVAVRPDGRLILQMKDVRGTVLGYMHASSGQFISQEQLDLHRATSDLVPSHSG